MTVPLPGLKPQEDGSYQFCARCAAAWVVILAAVGLGVLLYVRSHKGAKHANG